MAQQDVLSIEVSEGQDRTVMRLIGELDMGSAPAVVNRLQLDGRSVLLDLSEVTFMDSMGLSAVLLLAERCGCLKVIRGPRGVQRVFEITGTIEHFDWVE